MHLFIHQHTFRKGSEKKHQRDLEADGRNSSVNYKDRDKNWLVETLQETKEKLKQLEKMSTLLTFDITRLKKSTKQWKKEIKELANSGTIGEVASSLITSFKRGNVQGKDGVVNIMKVIAKNLAKKPKGHRYVSTKSTDYTDLFEAALILGGVKTCTFLSDNLDGPDVDTVKRLL